MIQRSIIIMKYIDLRSDTVTKPTEDMRVAMKNASVGDDVFGDDPTVNELEEYAAKLFGMESALFVSSGTQGNLVSVMSHTKPGDEILLEKESHIYYYEVGGLAAIAGAIPKLYESNKGYASKKKIEKCIRDENIHYPNTSLLCIENTHNRHGGSPLTKDQMNEMTEVALENNLNIHLDGARIFNAVEAYNTNIKEYTKNIDSISACLSKGLSAPIGSIVAGNDEFINIARKKRKMLGGGMRQVGVIAAAGLLALKNMRERLNEDHENAKLLAEGMIDIGLEVWDTKTNIVVCDTKKIFNDSKIGIDLLAKNNIFCVPFSNNLIRFTTHRHISKDDIEVVLENIKSEWLN